MPRCAWTTAQPSKSAANKSYAERLRHAANQKATESNDCGLTPESSETNKEASIEQSRFDDKTELAVNTASSSPAKDIGQSTSPSRAHHNVWETRMQQRAAVHNKKVAETPLSEGSIKYSPLQDNVVEQEPTMADRITDDHISLRTDAKPAHDSVTISQAGKQNEASKINSQPTKFPDSLPDSEVWLERIHLLNGGRPVSRYGKSSSPSTSAEKLPTDFHEDLSPKLHERNAIPTTPFQDSTGQRSTASDGSYAPIRSSDHQNPNYQAYVQTMGSAPMNCFPLLPMPLPAEYLLHPDDRNWSRRNRESRSRGRGAASRGRANAMPVLPQIPFFYPPISPYMMMPATAMPPSTIPKAAPSESTDFVAKSPAKSHAESQGDANTDTEGTEPQPRANLKSLPSSPEKTGGKHLQYPLNATPQPPFTGSAFLPPSQQVQGVYPNFSYMLPPQPMVGQLDPRASPMMLPPGAFPIASHAESGFAMGMHLSTAKQMLAQLEFYFSDANLEQDFFLRQQMDSDGFVLLRTILNFKRVQSILQTASDLDQAALQSDGDLAFLRDIIELSPHLELNEQKSHVRKRYGWTPYVLHTAKQ